MIRPPKREWRTVGAFRPPPGRPRIRSTRSVQNRRGASVRRARKAETNRSGNSNDDVLSRDYKHACCGASNAVVACGGKLGQRHRPRAVGRQQRTASGSGSDRGQEAATVPGWPPGRHGEDAVHVRRGRSRLEAPGTIAIATGGCAADRAGTTRATVALIAAAARPWPRVSARVVSAACGPMGAASGRRRERDRGWCVRLAVRAANASVAADRMAVPLGRREVGRRCPPVARGGQRDLAAGFSNAGDDGGDLVSAEWRGSSSPRPPRVDGSASAAPSGTPILLAAAGSANACSRWRHRVPARSPIAHRCRSQGRAKPARARALLR